MFMYHIKLTVLFRIVVISTDFAFKMDAHPNNSKCIETK